MMIPPPLSLTKSYLSKELFLFWTSPILHPTQSCSVTLELPESREKERPNFLGILSKVSTPPGGGGPYPHTCLLVSGEPVLVVCWWQGCGVSPSCFTKGRPLKLKSCLSQIKGKNRHVYFLDLKKNSSLRHIFKVETQTFSSSCKYFLSWCALFSLWACVAYPPGGNWQITGTSSFFLWWMSRYSNQGQLMC